MSLQHCRVAQIHSELTWASFFGVNHPCENNSAYIVRISLVGTGGYSLLKNFPALASYFLLA